MFKTNAILASHIFSERQKVKVAVGTFTGFATIWWSEHCWLYLDYVPTTWDDLKLFMRERFIDVYYTHGMMKKTTTFKTR